MPVIEEYHLQRALILWLKGNPDKFGTPRQAVMLAPGVEVWHTPNGGDRNEVEARRLKEMGTLAGIHDVFFLRPTQFTEGVFGLLFGLELKKPGGPQPPIRQLHASQKLIHPRLIRAGIAASAVVDNLPDAKAFCFHHLLTVNN